MHASADESDALRQAARQFAMAALSRADVRAAIDAGTYPQHAWRTLSTSLGLTGIGIPECYGGGGYSFRELGIALEELGAGLAPIPMLSTTVSAAAVLSCGTDAACAEFLPPIATGATVAVPVLRSSLGANQASGSWLVDGIASQVADAPAAEVFIVAAEIAAGHGLFAVRSAHDAVTVRGLNGLDGTRPLGAVEFAGAPATLLGAGPSPWPRLQLARDAQLAALACEQVGGAARCLDMTVAYAKTRVQFGVPIGTFQAVKHRCADLLVELEAARSLAYDARDAIAAAFAGSDDDDGGYHARVSAAAAWCSDTYVHVAQETIQLHGGIGFTWEHDAHLHLRRARTDQLLYGTAREHRRELAAAIGVTP